MVLDGGFRGGGSKRMREGVSEGLNESCLMKQGAKGEELALFFFFFSFFLEMGEEDMNKKKGSMR